MPPAVDATTAGPSLEDKMVAFASCGLDRVCPASVTTRQCQDVRLDQYQREKSINHRRQKIYEGCETSHRRFTISSPSICMNDSIILDHEFEWYDLDAIREVDHGFSNDDCAIIISHDFNAGLLFTTERQVLSNGVKVNAVSSSVSNKARENGQEFEFDLFFWVNNDDSKVGETQDEREFRERMEELEQEMKSDSSTSSCSLPHLSSSLSSFEDNESKNGDDRDGNSSFFASWLFEDAKIQEKQTGSVFDFMFEAVGVDKSDTSFK